MNKEQIHGQFEQFKAAIKKTWGKLTDDDVMLLDGQQEQFFGKLEERYGIARADAEKRMAEMEKTFSIKI